MPGPVKKRAYDADARRRASATTRRRILDAARNSLVEHGYRATTVSGIARAAGVHVDTVYELVGRKHQLVVELIELALSGTDEAVAGRDRAHVREMQSTPDPATKLTIYARAIRDTQQRLAPLFLALRDASTTDPEAGAIWRRISDRRAANMRLLVADIAATGRLRADLSVEEAADAIWATNSSELFVMLTGERGWSLDQYERWLAATWCRLLLRGSDDGGS